MSFSIFSQVDPSLTMNYLILGYGVMWLICALYVANLASRQRNLRRDIHFLRRLLEEDEG
ncbi:MAG: CcmD family protein [Chloroflexi bacterium]|nr:CcmD family protein [Chloroflexota bacterium]MDA0243241.1 CcmD family protein [Chloroflexota bacterium]